jgi:hypothetical protein
VCGALIYRTCRLQAHVVQPSAFVIGNLDLGAQFVLHLACSSHLRSRCCLLTVSSLTPYDLAPFYYLVLLRSGVSTSAKAYDSSIPSVRLDLILVTVHSLLEW